MTAPIADDERLVDVLSRRADEGRKALADVASARWQNLSVAV
jgi:predicted deacetylase